MTRRTFVIALLALSFLVAGAGSSQAGDGFVIIVNDSNTTESISREDLSRIFLKKLKKWDNGLKASVVDQNRNSSVRAAFSEKVLHRSVSAVTSYWQNKIFSGRGVPPVELQSDADVVAFVRGDAGAVGYVSPGASKTGVKVLTVR